MNTRRLTAGLVSLGLLTGFGAWSVAQPPAPAKPAAEAPPKGEEKEGDEEQIITLDKAPVAVRSAAIKLAGDAKNITKVIREEDEEDVVTFEVEYTQGAGKDAVKCAAIFSTGGDLMETEKATTMDKLPAALVAALKKEYPKGTFESPEIVTKTFYEVTVVVDGKKHAVKADAAGNIEDESEGGDAKKDGDGEKGEKDEKGEKGEHAAAPGADGWRAAFDVKKADLAPVGAGTYFVLTPGHTMSYAGGDVTLVITALNETKVVDGVTTRVIEERESKGGTLVEVSRNYFAMEPKSGDTYYFGEDVDIYKDGKVANHEGSWLAGKDGAMFGLFITGKPTVGEKFYQEVAPGNALDRFEIVSVTERVETPAGTFDKVVKTEETTPLEKGKAYKWFAPGVGMIVDGDLKLTKVTAPAK